MTAYRSRPSPCQRSISLRPSASAVSGVVSRSGRRMRSLTTWPAVIRSPLRPAAAKKRSIAEAKCAPKTSAVVVPAWASAVRNSAATASAYAVLGQLRLLGQRAPLQPVEQRHAQSGDHPDLRVVHMGVDQARQEQALAKVDHLVLRVGPGHVRVRAAGDDHAVADHDGGVGLDCEGARPDGEGIAGHVHHRGAVERHKERPSTGSGRIRAEPVGSPDAQLRDQRSRDPDRDHRGLLADQLEAARWAR